MKILINIFDNVQAFLKMLQHIWKKHFPGGWPSAHRCLGRAVAANERAGDGRRGRVGEDADDTMRRLPRLDSRRHTRRPRKLAGVARRRA
jgi:hypothetical protein